MSRTKVHDQWAGCVVAALMALGCGGKSVTLDRAAGMEVAAGGADADGVIVRGLGALYFVAVDDDRLYWVNESTIYGCLKSGCAPSLVNYYTEDLGPNPSTWGVSWLGVEGGEVIWASPDWLKSCPGAGCGGEPKVLGSRLPNAIYAVSDSVIVGWGDGGIYSMPRRGGEWVRLVETAAVATLALAVHEGFVYWIDMLPGGVDIELLRISTDGSKSVEKLADLVAPSIESGLAFDSSFVYFTDGRQSGAILRCPLEGCGGAPEDVLGPLRAPSQLAVDEHGLCVHHAVGILGQPISCAANSRPPVHQVFSDAATLVMDADYLYAVHADIANHDRFDLSRRAR